MPPSLLGSIIKNDAGMPPSLLGSFGDSFGWAKKVFGFSNSNKFLSCPFRRHLGWDGVDGTRCLAVFHLPFWETSHASWTRHSCSAFFSLHPLEHNYQQSVRVAYRLGEFLF